MFLVVRGLETLPPGKSDLVMLSNGDRSQGEFERLDAAFVRLKVGKTSLKLDRSRVRAIRLNPELINATRPVGPRAMLTLIDGSRLTANRIELNGEMIALKSLAMGDLRLPLTTVATCQFFGERVIPITDYELKPRSNSRPTYRRPGRLCGTRTYCMDHFRYAESNSRPAWALTVEWR